MGFILFATLFLFAFGNTHWQYLALVCVLAPATSAVLFSRAEVPAIRTPERASGAVRMLRDRGVWLCVLAIFLGGASECAMSQWSSSYLEQALGMEKIWGGRFGVALFAAMLGLGRTLYAKRGRHAARVLFVGAGRRRAVLSDGRPVARARRRADGLRADGACARPCSGPAA